MLIKNYVQRRADVYISTGSVYNEQLDKHFEKQSINAKSTHKMWDKYGEQENRTAFSTAGSVLLFYNFMSLRRSIIYEQKENGG